MKRPRYDGRWIAAAGIAVYILILGLGAGNIGLRDAWRRLGVYAGTPVFLDLRLFPATHATIDAGGDPYVDNPHDPLRRKYNYPRLWLTFMRFPDEARIVAAIAVFMTISSVALVFWFWGRLTPRQGLYCGAIVCSPSFMLGVERGNTDLVILSLLTLGLMAIKPGARGWRHALPRGLWLGAAVLKLYPIFALAALPARSFRAWLKIVLPPAVLFLAYIALTWDDVGASLRNTGIGWAHSYGARVPASAAEMVFAYLEKPGFDRRSWEMMGTLATILLCCLGALIGWRLLRNSPPSGPSGNPRAMAGFRIAALIYAATFLAGGSFDYRQCFVLLALPQLFAWSGTPGALRRLAMVALGCSLPALGINFVLASWTGFLVKSASGAFLAASFVGLFVASLRFEEPASGESIRADGARGASAPTQPLTPGVP